MYLFLRQHSLITSDLLFNMLSSLCRAMASFSLRRRRHRLEFCISFRTLWVPKIFQDMFEVLFADIITPNIHLIVFFINLVFDAVECIKWAFVFSYTGVCSCNVILWRIDYFFVMRIKYVFHVGHATVTYFNVVFIEQLIKFVVSRKVLIN